MCFEHERRTTQVNMSYWTTMMHAQTTSVPFGPKELNKICCIMNLESRKNAVRSLTVAIGCLMGFSRMFLISVPMQNVKATMMADNVSVVSCRGCRGSERFIPQPKIPADVEARMIAHGIAMAALVASSLMCTVEPNAPLIRD